ncbi:MAG: hypothetical protein IJT16_01510 [Lachnospiraceae bacterium]|nr:hypothetical protein [Lachnospiraceae bacterium]
MLFLTVLKTIGITLLVILGVLLLLILLVLFVPIRYRVDGSKVTAGNCPVSRSHTCEWRTNKATGPSSRGISNAQAAPAAVSAQGSWADTTAENKLEGKAVISWLLHLLHISAEYQGGLTYCVRLLGIPIKRSGVGENEKPSRKKKRKNKRKSKKRKKPDGGHRFKRSEKNPEADAKDTEITEQESVKYEDMDFRIESYEDVSEEGRATEENSDENSKEEKQASVSGLGENNVKADSRRETDTSKTESGDMLKEEVPKENTEEESDSNEEGPKEDSEEDKQSLFEKLGEFFGKLWEFFVKRKEKLETLWNRLKQPGRKIDFYVAFLSDENTKEQLSNIFKETGKLFRHIRPKKFRCALVFGTEEPDTTGQILSLLAIIYPFFGGGLVVSPRFQESILDIDLNMRGRIRIFTVLLILFRIYFHKGFRKMMKDYRTREV